MAEQHNGTMTTAEALQVYTQLVHRLSLRHGITFQGARDMYATLGYPDEITYQDYYARYKRGGIAKTIIDAFVDDTWRKAPQMRDVDKPEETDATPFEATWEQLAKRLRLWRVIRRLDLQARLGRFAVLVLGLRGQTDWSRPATPVRNADDLLYIQAFSEEHCEIVDLVTEDDASLFGTPRLYSIDFSRSQGALLLPRHSRGPHSQGSMGNGCSCMPVAAFMSQKGPLKMMSLAPRPWKRSGISSMTSINWSGAPVRWCGKMPSGAWWPNSARAPCCRRTMPSCLASAFSSLCIK